MRGFPSIYDARSLGHPGTTCSGDSRTKQSFKDECDINKIMRRYNSSGVAPAMRGNGVYGDFSTVGDYMECVSKLDKARAQFSGLSSELRARFRNDPSEMLAFVADSSNRAEAEKLGLLRVPEAKPQEVVKSDATK